MSSISIVPRWKLKEVDLVIEKLDVSSMMKKVKRLKAAEKKPVISAKKSVQELVDYRNARDMHNIRFSSFDCDYDGVTNYVNLCGEKLCWDDSKKQAAIESMLEIYNIVKPSNQEESDDEDIIFIGETKSKEESDDSVSSEDESDDDVVWIESRNIIKSDEPVCDDSDSNNSLDWRVEASNVVEEDESTVYDSDSNNSNDDSLDWLDVEEMKKLGDELDVNDLENNLLKFF